MHVKGVKDPVGVGPPGGKRVAIALRMEKARDRISPAQLDNVPLNKNSADISAGQP